MRRPSYALNRRGLRRIHWLAFEVSSAVVSSAHDLGRSKSTCRPDIVKVTQSAGIDLVISFGFPNLPGETTLIVPAPVSPDHSCYTHLGNFLRAAPAGQVDRFWQVVGETMQQRVSASPLWLSTAGMGVSWLHLRLDSRPKYYRHRPYAAGG